jgi:hypothetical protein
LTDHWGLASADLILAPESTKTPVANTVTRAQNELGDHVDEAAHGNQAGTLFVASCTYVLAAGSTLDLSTLQCGEIASGKVVTSIAVSTNNGQVLPRITVAGQLGTEDVEAPAGYLNTYSLPAITITGVKKAQLFDFTAGAACRLTSSTLTATVDLAQENTGAGEPLAHGLSGGVVAVAAELVAVSGACTWTPGVTWEETQKPGTSEGQAAWHTASGGMEKIMARDTSI